MTICHTVRIRSIISFAVGFGLFALVASSSVFGGILESKWADRTIEGVKLAKEVSFQGAGKTFVLKPYASGIRKKKVALFWAKVYVAQIFTPEGAATPPTSVGSAYETLTQQPLVALTMTFLRDVPAGRQRDAFEDALQANGIDTNAEAITPLFAMVEKAGDTKDTLTNTFVFERRSDATEWVHLENGRSELQSIRFEKGMLSKILSIWFGKPADSGMERLQRQFLGKSDD